MLYLVATPIGNLGDITLRALETLRAVDLVISEDTRKTGVLLNHFDIRKPQLAFHEHNEHKILEKLLTRLEHGEDIALVTDAGSPTVSDPGFLLVRAAHERGLPVTTLPGASAPIAALILSGLPAHAFTFRGFSPRKSSARRKFLALDADSPHTLIFFESPYRLKAFLADALEVFGDRPACVANDLTKKFETLYRGTLAELVETFEHEQIRGEYTVVIAGRDAGAREASEDPDELD